MSTLTTPALVTFAFAPLALTIVVFVGVCWLRLRNRPMTIDRSEALLAAVVRRMPMERSDWGTAMLAELYRIEGTWSRWRFALSCARVVLFPPRMAQHSSSNLVARVMPPCGTLSVVLPPLGLPLLYFCAIASNAFMEHDDFSSGELVPTLLGACILGSIACILAGIPLGVAAFVRREKCRWLSWMGPVWSVSVFSYLQIVQYLAARNLN
jgi:hypothetical protein